MPDTLTHYGVKGMKWGVIRSKETLDRIAGRKAEEASSDSPFSGFTVENGTIKPTPKRGEYDWVFDNMDAVVSKMESYEAAGQMKIAKRLGMDEPDMFNQDFQEAMAEYFDSGEQALEYLDEYVELAEAMDYLDEQLRREDGMYVSSVSAEDLANFEGYHNKIDAWTKMYKKKSVFSKEGIKKQVKDAVETVESGVKKVSAAVSAGAKKVSKGIGETVDKVGDVLDKLF